MRAATRDEIPKGNEWKIYDYVTRHFIASLHDDFEYMEKSLKVDIGGFKFIYKWHEVTERGIHVCISSRENVVVVVFTVFAILTVFITRF